MEGEKIFLCPCNIIKNLRAYWGRAWIFLFLSVGCFILDRWVKEIVLGGLSYEGKVVSIVLVFNQGVAFSMLAFLGEWLKWIQLAFIIGLFYCFLTSKEMFRDYFIPLALLIGSGASNLYDRFEYGGVVDYIFWHYQFEFAIFNLADVFVNLGIAILLFMLVFSKKGKSIV